MPNCFPKCHIISFYILSSSVKSSSCSTSLSTLGGLRIFDLGYSSKAIGVLICISLMTNNVSCTSHMYLLVWNVCSNILSISWWGREVVYLSVIEWLLKYILDESPLLETCFAEVLNFNEVLLVVWFDLYFLCLVQETLPKLYYKYFSWNILQIFLQIFLLKILWKILVKQ